MHVGAVEGTPRVRLVVEPHRDCAKTDGQTEGRELGDAADNNDSAKASSERSSRSVCGHRRTTASRFARGLDLRRTEGINGQITESEGRSSPIARPSLAVGLRCLAK